MRRFLTIFGAGLTLLSLATPAAGDEAATALTIGEHGAVARTRMMLTFPTTTVHTRLDVVPADADPASISIVPVSSPVRLVTWQRSIEGMIDAELVTDFSGQRSFDVLYAVTGLQWFATYQLVVRADPEREDAPVSMDVEGRITLRNRSRSNWSNATLRVVGAPVRPSEANPPGILELDDESPLADLWNEAAARIPISHAYDLDRRVSLGAGEERAFMFVSVERRPAERLYRLTSADIPVGTREPGRPLRRYIALANDASNGLGKALPPGQAQIYRGSTRATLGEQAWLDHTPANGEIRIELGPSARVRGIRRTALPTPGSPGEVEQECEIEVRNDLESPAHVEIEERPPTRQFWAVMRSSHPFETSDRRLLYRIDVPPRDKAIIRYVIRSPAPQR